MRSQISMEDKAKIHHGIMEDALKDGREIHSLHPAIKILVGLGLVLLMILIIVPYYSISNNPSPKHIPALAELSVPIPSLAEKSPVVTKADYLSLVDPSNPDLKRIADTIASRSCLAGRVCHAKAMFLFVRDNIRYISDPPGEYVETPLETLSSGGADCDGTAVLLANLLEAVGIHTRFVFTSHHVYVEAKLPQAISRDKGPDDWVPLDATCKDCAFGDLPPQDVVEKKDYVESW